MQNNQDEISINLKNINLALWNRRFLIFKIFTVALIFFIAITFISAKKWTVSADLYINKANSTNNIEINPFAMEDMTAGASVLGNADPLANELELIQSPLVIDKVIKDNDLRFKKLFNIIPTKKTGEYLTTEKFLKKGPSFETKKGTKVLHISYTSKDKDLSYNVVNSIITNYIALHKEINSEKSKADKALLEAEYNKAKAELDKKVNSSSGIPSTAMGGTGNMAAMSAFSQSAQKAMATLKGQLVAGEKSKIDISESASKVSQLASKLQWAKLMEEMSDSSKVLVIKEPYQLRDWEYSSPKLLINILLGIVFGIIFSIIGVVHKEKRDKKLSYTMLGNDVIYDFENEFDTLSAEMVSNQNQKNAFVLFDDVNSQILEQLKQFKNTIIVKAAISSDFTEQMNKVDAVNTIVSINKTDSKKYKLVKKMLENMNKKVLYDVIIK